MESSEVRPSHHRSSGLTYLIAIALGVLIVGGFCFYRILDALRRQVDSLTLLYLPSLHNDLKQNTLQHQRTQAMLRALPQPNPKS